MDSSQKFWRQVLGADLVIPCILLIIYTGIQPGTSYLMGMFLNNIGSSSEALTLYLPLIAGISFAAAIVGLAAFRLNGYSAVVITARLRKRIFSVLMTKSARYFDQNNFGKSISLIGNDCNIINMFIKNGVPELIRTIFGSIYYIASVAVISWQFSLIIVGECLAILGLSVLFNKKGRPVYKAKLKNNGFLSGFSIEVLQGWKTIKVYQQQSKVRAKISSIVAGFIHEEHNEGNLLMWSMFMATTVYSAAIVGAGILAVDPANQFMGGDFFVAWTGVIAVYANMRSLSAKITEISQVQTSAEAIYKTICNTHDEEKSLFRGQISHCNDWTLAFENVTFRYARNPVLCNFSVTIKEKFIAFVGASGAGKSTILNLILGLYAPQEGKVTLGGHDLLDLNEQWYYSNIGYVAQETFLFNDSIEENIRSGSQSTLEEVMEAARLSYAHDFIMDFTEGYKTILGEGGVQLSGGQKQRISIARALLRKPKILIMDEATSALDSKADSEIQKAIEAIALEHTVIIVAHRLTTVRKAEKIYVVQGGYIEEVGTFEQLVESKGLFSSMVALQSVEANAPSIRSRSTTM